MKLTKSNRGFSRFEFKDDYGEECSIQKSSSAEEDKIWLGVNNVKPCIMARDAARMNRNDLLPGPEDPERLNGWVEFHCRRVRQRRVKEAMMKSVMLAMLALPGCVCLALTEPLLGTLPGTCQPYTGHALDVTAYPFHADAHTPSGIAVDTSSQAVDLARIDAIVDDVMRCVLPPALPRRCPMRVKVAPNWITSPSGVQIFPCAGPTLWCAGAEQQPSTAVVTPNLAALAHEAAHIITGADDGVDILSKCGG